MIVPTHLLLRHGAFRTNEEYDAQDGKRAGPRFAATIAAREAEVVHVAAPLLAGRETFAYHLEGATAAFAECAPDPGL